MARKVLSVVCVALALACQVIGIDRLPLPGGVVPDLVLLTVIALALVNGPMPGVVTGFLAGLATDIVPPADHTIGQYAFVFCLVGYIAGLAQTEVDRSTVLPFGAMVLGVVLATVGYALLGALLGDPRISWAAVKHTVPLTVLYDVVLSPFVLWLIVALSRRFGGTEHDGGVLGGGTLNVERYKVQR